eukprot:PITA_30946
MACAPRAVLPSIRRAFSTNQLHPQQWSSASPQWPQNLYSMALKTFVNGQNCLRFHGLILSQKFYSTDASATVQILEDEYSKFRAVNNEEEEDSLPGLTGTVETPEKEKWKLANAIIEIQQVLVKGDEDMEETLTQLGFQITPQLVKSVLGTASSPNSALRFFQWAKTQPGFQHNISTYDKLVDILGRSKDFETLQRVLPERSGARCDNFSKTFSFAAGWHNDSDMLDKLMEMFDKLELSVRRGAYERLIATFCENNHVNTALKILKKMATVDCAPKMSTYRPLIQRGGIQGALQLFDRLKKEGINPLYATYSILFNKLFQIKGFGQAHSFLTQQCGKDPKLDSFMYSHLIKVCSKSGRHQEASNLLKEKKAKGL